jgi:hypothetical protein
MQKHSIVFGYDLLILFVAGITGQKATMPSAPALPLLELPNIVD